MFTTCTPLGTSPFYKSKNDLSAHDTPNSPRDHLDSRFLIAFLLPPRPRKDNLYDKSLVGLHK